MSLSPILRIQFNDFHYIYSVVLRPPLFPKLFFPLPETESLLSILSPFHRWENRGTEKLRTRPRLHNKPVAEPGFDPGDLGPERVFFISSIPWVPNSD